MRRLLSVNNYHYLRGGAEEVYFNHAKLFEAHGWQNVFFSTQHENNIDCETAAFFPSKIDYGSTGRYGRTVGNAVKMIYSVEARVQLARLLDEKSADVVHLHNIYHHLSPSIIWETKRRGIPTVLTAHDLKLVCPSYRMYNDQGICERCKNGKIWNVLLQRCIKQSYLASGVVLVESATHRLMKVYEALDKIVAPSRFYVQKMEEWGVAPEKLIHIPNFLFVPDDMDAMPSPSPASYILYFGRLSSEKGLETLIRAAKQAKVSVKVLGSGPQDEYLRAMAAKLEAPVEFCGYQSGDALRAYLDHACAVVLPSEWYENGPMSAVYAFARGKPLIGARIGGIMEMVVEGVTGWGFAAGDVEDLARALSQAESATRETLEEMGAACRRYFLEKHSPEAYYGAMSALYDDLLRR